MRGLAMASLVLLSSRRLPGQGMVEYALIIGFVALVVVAALAILGPQVATFFNKAANSLPV